MILKWLLKKSMEIDFTFFKNNYPNVGNNMNILMKPKLEALSANNSMNVLDYVRQRIAAIFFRGDILGQASRIRKKQEAQALKILGDSISGLDLELEDNKRLASYSH